MSAPEALNELAERKRLLRLQGDLQRTLIQAECDGLRSRLNLACERVRSAGPWLLAGGVTIALLAPRHWRKLRWIRTTLAAWRWLRRRQGY